MGFALAEACAEQGAEVTLIAGPVSLTVVHPNIKRIDVESAEEMYQAAITAFPEADAGILCAAVADYRPDEQASEKIKRETKGEMTLRLVPNKDIAASLGMIKRENQVLVGFALETNDETAHAEGKLKRKNLDFIVLNSLRDAGAGFRCDTNKITIIDKDGKEVAHQTGATPGAAKLEDVDGNGVIDSKDRKVIGSKQPSFTMSMGNRFSYKDFYFSFLFNGVFGKWMTDNVANISSYTFGSGNYILGVIYWTPETPDAEVVSPGYQASFSHGYYKKLNYVQLRNITLGYRVNQKFVRRIGLSAIDVNFSVNNVCAFSNMRQMLKYDNSWYASFPTARSNVLGLTLTF